MSLFKVATILKFAKIVRAGLEDDLAKKCEMEKFTLFYIMNNYIDIYNWMECLGHEKTIFQSTMYELGTSYKCYKMLDSIRERASNLSVVEYAGIAQVKEKLGTIRIYPMRHEAYYAAIDDVHDSNATEVMRNVESFDRYVEEVEDRATEYLQFERSLQELLRKQRKFSVNEGSTASTEAVVYGVLAPNSISPNRLTCEEIVNGTHDLINKKWMMHDNWRDYQSPPDDVINKVTEAINELCPR